MRLPGPVRDDQSLESRGLAEPGEAGREKRQALGDRLAEVVPLGPGRVPERRAGRIP